MAIGGFFLGGAADGFKVGEEMRLKRDELTQKGDLNSQYLKIAQQSQENTEKRTVLGEIDKQVETTMTIVSEAISSGIAAGKDPAMIAKAVQPLVDSAKDLAKRGGRDPAALDVRVSTWMAGPQNEGTKKVVKIGSDLSGDRYGVLNESTGEITPVDGAMKKPTAKGGQPALTESDVITPRQVQVANAAAPQSGGVPRIDDAFAALTPAAQAQPPAPAAPAVPSAAPATRDTRQRIDFAAEQYLGGNKDVLAGFGGSKQGAAMRREIMDRAAELAIERNMKPEEVNSNIAQFMGQKRGASALGQRMAIISSSNQMAAFTLPRVLEASNNVDRTSFPDINKIILAAKEKTGDQNVVKFGIALNTFVLAYARAQGGGSSLLTDSARHEASALLQRAWSKGQIGSALDQMMIELKAEEEGAKAAVQGFPEKYKKPGDTSTPKPGDLPPLPPGFIRTK